ncbi:MAG: aldo/keto reductase [Polyangiaceae bacterium]|nr:aldo/keto reductase [Polyangiaceae bacterium]
MATPVERQVALGWMRLSTESIRNDARSIELLTEALNAGVRHFDTADVYARDDSELGHNENLIRRALASWSGDRSTVTIATKGGLTRPGGKWIPNAKAGHLKKACEASLKALGVQVIDLYQLHVVDSKTPLATTARALADLQQRGWVKSVGLCNVTIAQIEEARAILPISSVQVKLGPLDMSALKSGLVSYCIQHHIRVFAYRPLGAEQGVSKLLRDPALVHVAQKLGCTPVEVALAWLYDIHPLVTPLPGPTRVETVKSCVFASHLVLDDEDRAVLDARFPEGGAVRRGENPALLPPLSRVVPAGEEPHVVIVMGMPGAGKSTLTGAYASNGYTRLNRDEMGGRLSGVALALDAALENGAKKVVLDNTYATRALRADIVRIARRHGGRVKCVWVDTNIEDAQINACERLISRHGKLLSPAEMAVAAKSDPNAFPPNAQFRYKKIFELPTGDEGFEEVERRTFVRAPYPDRNREALFIDLDASLWKSRSGERSPNSVQDMIALTERAAKLRAVADRGVLLVGFSWQPEIAEKGRSPQVVVDCFQALTKELDLPMELAYCPHGGGPPVCWCRKPLPGLAVQLAHVHKLNLTRSTCVGSGTAEKTFAERLGMTFVDESAFF